MDCIRDPQLASLTVLVFRVSPNLSASAEANRPAPKALAESFAMRLRPSRLRCRSKASATPGRHKAIVVAKLPLASNDYD